MEKFIENKATVITSRIGTFFLIVSTLSLFISLFSFSFYFFNTFAISSILTFIFFTISSSLSNSKKFSNEFISIIKSRIKEATTKNELTNILKDIYDIAVDENGIIILSYPLEIKKLINEINFKIEILDKIKQ